MNYLWFILMVIHFILHLALCDEDYYKLLGVDNKATTDQIRKAFKKLAIRYHPDKNRDNPEAAKKIFAKMANAYEVLIDPEQRKIYDKYGEEGIKKPQEHSHNYEFNNFFRGFEGFNFHHNNGQNTYGYNHEEFQRRKNIFSNSDIIELTMETISKFYRREEVWYVYFYKPQNEKHLEISENLIRLSNRAESVFQIGSLNCRSEERCVGKECTSGCIFSGFRFM